MSTPTPATLRTRLVGLGATLVVLGIVAGLPIVLLALGANPVPHSLTSLGGLRNALSSPDDGTLAMGAVKVIAWAAWAFLTASILLEVAARLRGAHPPRLPGLALPQSAAHGLVAAALLLIVAAPVAAPAARAAATDAFRATNTTTASGLTSAGQHGHTFRANNAKDAEGASRRGRAASRNTHHPYTVRAGDTLSQIAEDHLGDATRYPEIFTASRHITQPGGAHLSDPDLIDVGWTLSIPGHCGPRDHTPRPAPERRLAGGSADAPHHGDPGASAVAPSPGGG